MLHMRGSLQQHCNSSSTARCHAELRSRSVTQSRASGVEVERRRRPCRTTCSSGRRRGRRARRPSPPRQRLLHISLLFGAGACGIPRGLTILVCTILEKNLYCLYFSWSNRQIHLQRRGQMSPKDAQRKRAVHRRCRGTAPTARQPSKKFRARG